MDNIIKITKKITNIPRDYSYKLFILFLKKESAELYSKWFYEIFSAAILALILRLTVIQTYLIPSESMIDTLQVGDRLFANKAAYWFQPIKRGDIIVFAYPKDPSKDFVKRVIGLPGDKVEIIDGKLYRNDQLVNEPYIKEPMWFDYPEHIVPENHLFVLGDNRNNSDDSRFWGFLPINNVKGKAYLIFWPIRRMQMVKHYKYKGNNHENTIK